MSDVKLTEGQIADLENCKKYRCFQPESAEQLAEMLIILTQNLRDEDGLRVMGRHYLGDGETFIHGFRQIALMLKHLGFVNVGGNE